MAPRRSIACTALLVCGLVVVCGCAVKSEKIVAAHASTLRYSTQSCARLERSYQAVNRLAGEVFAAQDVIAQQDTRFVTIGAIAYWPALLMVATSDRSSEVARIKGELAAIEEVAAEKGCTMLTKTMAFEKALAGEGAFVWTAYTGADPLVALTAPPETTALPSIDERIAYWQDHTRVLRQAVLDTDPQNGGRIWTLSEFAVIDARRLDENSVLLRVDTRYIVRATVDPADAEQRPARSYRQSTIVDDGTKRVLKLERAIPTE